MGMGHGPGVGWWQPPAHFLFEIIINCNETNTMELIIYFASTINMLKSLIIRFFTSGIRSTDSAS